MISGRGGFRLHSTLAEYLRSLESASVVLPITGAIAELSIGFTGRYPRNPIARLIGATAVVHGINRVTKVEGICHSGEVKCMW